MSFAGPGPERLGLVDRLQFRLVLRFLVVARVALLAHHHGDADVVRVLPDHRAQAEAVGEFRRVVRAA